jgi:hypothetical protein
MALVNPSSTMNEIVTTTLRSRTGKLADNVTKNNEFLNRLDRKGKRKMVNGGRTIVQEMEYAENGTYKRYSGYEALNISPSDVFTSAEFNYAQAAVAVSISGLEMIQNSGEAAIIDLLSSRISNAEKTITNNIALDCYSDGTADGGRQIGGLALLVSSTPTTGVVGGIDRSTTVGSFYRNKAFSALTNGGAAMSAANAQSFMNRLWLTLKRGSDKPDLIVADNNYYRAYWESLQAIQRIGKSDGSGTSSTLNPSLQYETADVVFDGGVGGGCPANTMYFLNTDYIYFRPAAGRNFEPLGGERESVNQDAMVKLIVWAGNMTLSNGSLQGVLTA